jgi:hypothetical protein
MVTWRMAHQSTVVAQEAAQGDLLNIFRVQGSALFSSINEPSEQQQIWINDLGRK